MPTDDRLNKAKEKDIVTYLKNQGIEPAKPPSGNSYYYLSFFKPENNPSLIVFKNTNRFKDFSSGKTGDLMDLVMHFEHCTLWEAIEKILDEKIKLSLPSYEPKEVGPGIEVVEIMPLTSQWLKDYLTNERKITLDIAMAHCREAHVIFPRSKYDKTKRYKFVAFKNKKDGYELRNPLFKFSTSPKYYTESEKNTYKVSRTVTFEGFMDYLSYLTRLKTVIPPYKTFILNGISNITYLHGTYKDYLQNDMYIDDDIPATEKLLELRELGIKYNDKRNNFYGYKDFNEAHKDDFRATKEASQRRKELWQALVG